MSREPGRKTFYGTLAQTVKISNAIKLKELIKMKTHGELEVHCETVCLWIS